jgi:hypothetical protein
MSNESTTKRETKMKLDTAKLAEMGYGDLTGEGATVELTDAEIEALAESVGGSVAEIATAEAE